jgi:hypothetical protein
MANDEALMPNGHGSKFRVHGAKRATGRFKVAGFRPENANLPTLNLER